ncbi:seryl-tRNA synthetase-like protein [Methanococcus vannielii SB]|uniref:Seryl-tRNA synthetase-like protein n=1 Tax=Methanococcus vannielii (strain ATCC 35089 / DSM 1224 / JCM 13029 / OCM 148 / SB) TaxID=406327 RepID=A6UNC5_METVS|nr:PC4/YdbC family ssDNA-binding protein [Methanococcus vannielii]ABR53997.1 seryl-tRNA synthetase-like protein [Methanococcus vannielii SB]
MAEVTFEIVKHIKILSESKKGWKKELNLVSWNNNEPKYDIREWSQDHTKMSKGITITPEELKILKDILNEIEIKL